jgi:hypothetical protein
MLKIFNKLVRETVYTAYYKINHTKDISLDIREIEVAQISVSNHFRRHPAG